MTGIRSLWMPDARGEPERRGACKASCCKTPYGHATARDNYPKNHPQACHCHDQPKEAPVEPGPDSTYT